jgi:serine/threonine protein kinase
MNTQKSISIVIPNLLSKNNLKNPQQNLLKEKFEIIQTLAKSLFGSVLLVRKRNDSNPKLYALKEFSESIPQNSALNLKQELELEVERHQKVEYLMNQTPAPNNNNNNNNNNASSTSFVENNYTTNKITSSILSNNNNNINNCNEPVRIGCDSQLLQLQAETKMNNTKNQYPCQNNCLVKLIEHEFNDTLQYGYILYEYIGSDLLKHIVARKQNHPNKCLPVHEAYFLINEMIQTVFEFHSRRITHGDLSCENWLLEMDEEKKTQIKKLKLIDYSTVLYDHEPFNPATNRVKLLYSAPEVFKFKASEVSPQLKDVYSLGVCIYLLWCGSYPFSQKSYHSSAEFSKRSSASSLLFPNNVNDVRYWQTVYSYLSNSDENEKAPFNIRAFPQSLRILIAKMMHPEVSLRWTMKKVKQKWDLIYELTNLNDIKHF